MLLLLLLDDTNFLCEPSFLKGTFPFGFSITIEPFSVVWFSLAMLLFPKSNSSLTWLKLLMLFILLRGSCFLGEVKALLVSFTSGDFTSKATIFNLVSLLLADFVSAFFNELKIFRDISPRESPHELPLWCLAKASSFGGSSEKEFFPLAFCEVGLLNLLIE